ARCSSTRNKGVLTVTGPACANPLPPPPPRALKSGTVATNTHKQSRVARDAPIRTPFPTTRLSIVKRTVANRLLLTRFVRTTVAHDRLRPARGGAGASDQVVHPTARSVSGSESWAASAGAASR